MLKRPWKVFAASLAIVLASCAPPAVKPVPPPDVTSMNLDAYLEKLNAIKGVRTTVAVKVNRPEGRLKGDALIEVTEDELLIRVYSKGFLARELRENRGIITAVDGPTDERYAIVVDGVRNSLMWWTVYGYRVIETPDAYIVRNSWKRLELDRGTLAPRNLEMDMEDGSSVRVAFDNPRWKNGVNYPTYMNIELGEYSMVIDVEKLSFKHTSLLLDEPESGEPDRSKSSGEGSE